MQNDRDEQTKEWLKDFQSSFSRSLKERWDYSFIHTYKPVLDDKPYRSFETMNDYRKWCETYLPKWLGYGQNL